MDIKNAVKRGLSVLRRSKRGRKLSLCHQCKWLRDLEKSKDPFKFTNTCSTLGSLADVLKRECEFCQMIGKVVSERLRAANPSIPFEQSGWIVTYRRVRTLDLDVGAKKPRMGFNFYFGLPFWNPMVYDNMSQCIEITLEKSQSGVICMSILNVDKLKDILATCHSVHRGKCPEPGPVSITSLPTGFRLVDVRRMCITPAPVSCTYVALSYVWGSNPLRLTLLQSNMERLQTAFGLKFDELGKTIIDAVKLCQSLGEQYLWVDSLCIIQDLDDIKSAQIAAMDKVYSLASWTICATAGDDVESGLPGVFSREREFYIDNRPQDISLQVIPGYGNEPLEMSVWNTRGWTFQERELSRRCMYFCDRRMYWKCATSFIEEESGQFCEKTLAFTDKALINRQHLAQQRVERDYRDNWPETYEEETDGGYRWLVQKYTRRELRYEYDIQAAFAGVAAFWQTLLNTRLFYEIPERFLEIGLSWTNLVVQPRYCLDLPSWSWGSQVGAIDYPIRITGRLVQFYILDVNHTLRRLESSIPHTDEIGWPVGRSNWKTQSKFWLPQTEWNHAPILSSPMSSILKMGTLVFHSQIIKLRLGISHGHELYTERKFVKNLELRTEENDFAGLIEGSLRNLVMLEDLSAYMACEKCTFVGFAASAIRSSTMTYMPIESCGKGDAMVVAWLVRFDKAGVAYRVALARILLWIWESSSPETSTIYLR